MQSTKNTFGSDQQNQKKKSKAYKFDMPDDADCPQQPDNCLPRIEDNPVPMAKRK